MKHKKVYRMSIIALMTAFVFVATSIKIVIPIGGSNAMIHLGNAVCLLSGIILGPVAGGIASGLGSFLFDILNPVFISSSIFTFTFKFIMAFVCGKISHANNKNGENKLYNIAGAIFGSASYIILRILKNLIVYICFMEIDTYYAIILCLRGTIITIINAIIAIVISMFLSTTIKTLLRQYI